MDFLLCMQVVQTLFTHTHTAIIIKLTAGFFFASTNTGNKIAAEVGVCPLIIITSAAACFQMINNETSVTNVSKSPVGDRTWSISLQV